MSDNTHSVKLTCKNAAYFSDTLIARGDLGVEVPIGEMAMLVTGPNDRDLDADYRIQFIHIGAGGRRGV